MMGILSTIGVVIFALVIISLVGLSAYDLYKENKEYQTIKSECNQEINKDLCFCYRGSCEVTYQCNRGTSTQTWINDGPINSTYLEGNCKEYKQRLCEISQKAKAKDWIWRYCE